MLRRIYEIRQFSPVLDRPWTNILIVGFLQLRARVQNHQFAAVKASERIQLRSPDYSRDFAPWTRLLSNDYARSDRKVLHQLKCKNSAGSLAIVKQGQFIEFQVTGVLSRSCLGMRSGTAIKITWVSDMAGL